MEVLHGLGDVGDEHIYSLRYTAAINLDGSARQLSTSSFPPQT
jgi:hypothetical protein